MDGQWWLLPSWCDFFLVYVEQVLEKLEGVFSKQAECGFFFFVDDWSVITSHQMHILEGQGWNMTNQQKVMNFPWLTEFNSEFLPLFKPWWLVQRTIGCPI